MGKKSAQFQQFDIYQKSFLSETIENWNKVWQLFELGVMLHYLPCVYL